MQHGNVFLQILLAPRSSSLAEYSDLFNSMSRCYSTDFLSPVNLLQIYAQCKRLGSPPIGRIASVSGFRLSQMFSRK